jgi:putative nucleotidyltransferase with HDIG domain
MTDIREIVNEIETLRPIPPVAAQILELAEDINSSLAEIADLIIHDPSLTANVLRICNSANFGLSRKVESVHDAITLLGLNRIVKLVLLDSLSHNLSGDQQSYGLGEGELWRHAVLSAHVVKIMGANNGVPHNKHLVFTAALIKDIGKVILGRFVAFSFEKIHILVKSHGYSFNEAEKEIIGMNHEELGALMAERWRFSEKLIYIIRNHHLSDESARDDTETALVYLADLVCMMMGMSTGVDGLAYRFYSDVLNRMSLTEKDLQTVIAATGESWEKLESLLNLV